MTCRRVIEPRARMKFFCASEHLEKACRLRVSSGHMFASGSGSGSAPSPSNRSDVRNTSHTELVDVGQS